MSNRILVGVTLYAEPTMILRAKIAAELLERWNDYREVFPNFDLCLIDNGEDKPQVLKDAIEKALKQPNTFLGYRGGNLGWAGGRNKMMEIFMDGSWERLVMIDQDEWVEDPDWLKKIDDLIDKDPNLDAYMLTVHEHDITGTITLPSGVQAYTMREYLGGINVIGRRVIETIGAYDTVNLSKFWGWSDVLMGRRLIGSGLLDYTGKRYVDPIMSNTEHRNTSHLESESVALHGEMIGRYGGAFAYLEREALSGNLIYSEYRNG